MRTSTDCASTFLHADPSAHACVYATAAAASGPGGTCVDALPVKRTKSATKRPNNPVEMRDARSRALYSLSATSLVFAHSARGRRDVYQHR